MKKLITFLSIATTVAMLALPVAAIAQTTPAQPNAAAAQDPCSTEGKEALYADFLKNRQSDQPKAFEDAKKYLGCPASGQVTEGQQKIIDYLTKWSKAYEEGSKKINFIKTLYTDK